MLTAGTGPAVAESAGAPDRVPAPTPGRAGPEQAGPEHAGPEPLASVVLRVTGAALGIVGALLLGFVVDVGLLGPVRHDRDQQVTYATFRGELANATAPVGTGADGKLLPLGTPVALLEIPEIGVREIVAEGTTSAVLMSGPGHRRDTVLPGQAGVSVIMGRQAAFGGPFRHLDLLVPGQTFTVITGQGASTYRVLDLRRAGDPLPGSLPASGGRLTLVTGDGPAFGPAGVLRVDTDLISAPRPAPPQVFASVPAAEQAMAGDPSAWFLIVLWGQALVLAAIALAWSRARWGRWQTWVVGVAIIAAVGLALADQVARLLPNLL